MRSHSFHPLQGVDGVVRGFTLSSPACKTGPMIAITSYAMDRIPASKGDPALAELGCPLL